MKIKIWLKRASLYYTKAPITTLEKKIFKQNFLYKFFKYTKRTFMF